MAAWACATEEALEAIKGGANALKEMGEAYRQHQRDVAIVLEETSEPLLRDIVASVILHDIRVENAVADLVKREVCSEKDFGWRIQPR